MMRISLIAAVAGAALALASCDGTSPRVAGGDGTGGNGGGNGGGGMQPTPQLRTLMIDAINNNTNDTALPLDVNSLEFEIDTTPVNLDLVTG